MAEFEKETERLTQMRELIGDQLEDVAHVIEGKKQEIIRYREYLWEHHSHDGMPPEQLQEVQRQENAYASTVEEQQKLTALYGTPYFARIDFKEEGEPDEEPFYIGRYGFIDEEMEMPVYDWRSPVASMFYDYEYGKASYNCPAGVINGELTLKRQFIIEDGRLKSMFDSALEIQDEILQRMLSGSASDKMKTIITTIQREQNKAIRDESTDVLVISGNAGSGKTSIALHRISYLLYRHRDTLSEDNIIIFSPSDTFNGYISDVLPALGEKNVRQTTLQWFAESLLDTKAQDFFAYMESVLGDEISERRKALVPKKGSKEFAGFIERYIDQLSRDGMHFHDVAYLGRVIFTAQELTELFQKQTAKLSIEERLVKVRAAFYQKLETIKDKRVEQLKKQLVEEKGREYYLSEKELTADARVIWFREFKALEESYNAQNMLHGKQVYAEILKKYFDAGTAADFTGGETLCYEDIAPLLMILSLLGQLKPADGIRHAVIDEAQDYSYMQFKAMSLLLRYTKFTILGDVCQTVNLLDRPESFELLADVFGKRSVKFLNLTQTYRSTKEISDYAAGIIGIDSSSSIDRHGEVPQIVAAKTEDEKIARICATVRENQQQYATTAIITRTKKEAERLFEQLDGQIPAKLIADAGQSFAKGTLIIPCYLAKGLEFDSVIVDGSFDMQRDKNLFYVCCTRALHRLTVIQ